MLWLKTVDGLMVLSGDRGEGGEDSELSSAEEEESDSGVY